MAVSVDMEEASEGATEGATGAATVALGATVDMEDTAEVLAATGVATVIMAKHHGMSQIKPE